MSKWATSPNENEASQENQVPNNKFDAEIAMIEQRLLHIQKMKQDNISQQLRGECGTTKMVTSEKAGSNDGPLLEPIMYRTPEANTSLVLSERNHGRPHKPVPGTYRNIASHDGSFTMDEDMTANVMMPNYYYQTPKRTHSQMNENEKSDEVKKRSSTCQEDEGQANNEKGSKYIRMDPQEGRLVGGYYTLGQKEKLTNFMPAFWNIGNPMCPQEIIGIRKNTQFLPKNKGKAKLPDEKITYLVVSFENRKTKNSPFIEYPLSRLGSLIKALQDLKDFASENGYYNEGQILKSHYPENTVVKAKDTKETVLENWNNVA